MKIVKLTSSSQVQFTIRSTTYYPREEITAEIDSDQEDYENCAENLRSMVIAALAKHVQALKDIEEVNRRMDEQNQLRNRGTEIRGPGSIIAAGGAGGWGGAAVGPGMGGTIGQWISIPPNKTIK